jgi:hypothetical protein
MAGNASQREARARNQSGVSHDADASAEGCKTQRKLFQKLFTEGGMSVEHDQLVNIAARWLANRCSVVVTELNTVSGEIPDAIGWHGPHSILIECKVTRCDFKSDAGKFFRRCPEYGMGLSRYFLTPPGLVSVDELPPKWGLLEVKGARVRTLRKSEGHAVDNRKEIAVLLSVLRRIGSTAPKGIGIKCYTHGFSERSVLSIGQEETIAELLSGNLLEQFE